MPQISSFLGIRIRIYYRDHNPPHFHAFYGEYEGLVAMDKIELIGGNLPPRVLGLVIEWACTHQLALQQNWSRAINYQPLDKIEPLV
jgi:hypothetical protein